MSSNSKEVWIMANGYSTMNSHANCCAASAAVSTSVRLTRIMDTALLAVSIIICVLILGLVLNFT